MKHILCLLLCLALLFGLFACGQAEPDPTTAVPTTIEIENSTEVDTTTEDVTTEEPTTQAPIIGEGVRWRVIPTDTALRAGIAVWPDEEIAEYNKKTELKLSNNKTVIVNSKTTQLEIEFRVVLRNETTGSETLLFEHITPNDVVMRVPYLSCAFDERYFLITWMAYEGWIGCSVFDIQEKREIPIRFPDDFYEPYFLTYANDGYLYFMLGGEDYDLRVARISLSEFLKDNNLRAVEVFIDTEVGHTSLNLISPNGRYLAAEGNNTILVFDLVQKKCVLRLQPESVYQQWPHFVDDHTLYFYNEFNDESIIEITLP